MCNAMHRITNFLLHGRLAICDGDRNRGQDPHHRGGGLWKMITAQSGQRLDVGQEFWQLLQGVSLSTLLMGRLVSSPVLVR